MSSASIEYRTTVSTASTVRRVLENCLKPDEQRRKSRFYKDEVYVRHMIKHGLKNEHVEATYAASVILTGNNNDGMNSTKIVKISRKGKFAVLFVSGVIMENFINE